jgi:mono/diheme cytochrome c family protein
MRRLPFAFVIAAIAAILLLSACSLAGDVTPPPGGGSLPPAAVGTQPVAQAPADSGLGYPSAPPSAANGAAVYAAHCAQCHGASGQGDGTMAAQLQVPPANFTDPTLAHNSTPAGWFQTVTQGNLDRFMPPFGSTLSETDRWDVVLYLYTLTAPQDVVDKGREVYSANCASCHGEAGQGDGADAPAGSTLLDFSDESKMASLSQNDLFTAITQGAGQAMPAYAETLTEDERWAAAAYLRTFSYDYVAPGAAPAPGAASAESVGTVTGHVTNGTTGVLVSGSLDVVLYGFDNFQLATTLTETLQSDSSFVFDSVPIAPGRSFVVTTQYAGVLYGSDVLTFDSGSTQLDAPLNVYETTTDASGLSVQQMHVFFDFASGQTTVGELLIIANTGDRTVLGGQALQFTLPAGATDLRLDGMTAGQGYVETPTGFTLTRPIPPSDSAAQLLVSFTLPFDRKLDFSQPVPFPVAAVTVLIPDTGVKVSANQLQDDGPRDVQGTTFLSYSGTNLPAGTTLAFSLSGTPGGGTSPVTVDPAGLIAGGLALALVLGGVGWWYYSRRVEATVPATSVDDLLQAVADLDDDYAAGELGQGEYERRRTALKAQIARAMRTNP